MQVRSLLDKYRITQNKFQCHRVEMCNCSCVTLDVFVSDFVNEGKRGRKRNDALKNPRDIRANLKTNYALKFLS